MRLSQLIDPELRVLGPDVEVAQLTADSRKVRPGALFAALRGTRADGLDHAEDALARGAVAMLGDERITRFVRRATLVVAENPRQAFAHLAARFHPGRPRRLAAVTGTDGKSSTVAFTRDIWRALGHSAASLGTLGLDPPLTADVPPLTTPDPVRLHALLAQLAAAGITRLALEASSHGLHQYRLDGLSFEAAGFTRLGRDHLDYHGDMAHYFAAKARLFTELLAPEGVAVLPADDARGRELAARVEASGRRHLTYGPPPADIAIEVVRPRAEGLDLTLALAGTRRRLALPLLGPFQARNLALALGLVWACEPELGPEELLAAASAVRPVPGRMELVATTRAGVRVVVDYAHTPDALAAALTALRAHFPKGRLAVVFGCGGERDPGKRAPMGRIARELADRVVITDDNPRGEDPAAIRRQVRAGAGDQAWEIGDRAEAIAHALFHLGLRAGDAVLVAGKGHERGQLVGGRMLPFDDREVVRALCGGAA